MAKRVATEDLEEVVTGAIRRGVKRLHTDDEPRPEHGAPNSGFDPGSLRFAPVAAFAGAAPHEPNGADARAAPWPGGDSSSPSVPAHWKLRGQESSQRTPESPTRPPLTSEDSEGPETGQYADVNQLLRALHFERLLRLQARSPLLPAPDGAQARRDTQQ